MGQLTLQLFDDIYTGECRAFACAWQAWRGTDVAPKQSSVHIEDIARELHQVSVIEVISPEIA